MINKKSPAAQSGFTLVELMIAVTILSLLMFIGTFSYQQMAARWDKDIGSFDASAQQSKNVNLLLDVLGGVTPFIVVDQSKSPVFFFIGDEKSLLGVTKNGIFDRKYPEIFRMTAKENEQGKYDLIYQSASTQNVLLLTTYQEIIFEKQITLLKNMDDFLFEYLGWLQAQIYTDTNQTKPPATWFTSFSGIDNKLTPIKIKMNLIINKEKLSAPISLNNEPERLLASYVDEGS